MEMMEGNNEKHRKLIFSLVVAFLSGILMALGQCYARSYDSALWGDSSRNSICAVFVFFLILVFVTMFVAVGKRSNQSDEVCSKKYFLVPFVVLSIVYSFFLYCCYPGFLSYDGGNQMVQVLYEDVPYNAHHPLFHTLLLGGIIKIGYVLNGTDLTLGVLLYAIFQLLVCALCFSCAIYHTYMCFRRKLFTILSTAFYSLFPPILMFTICTTKDVLCYCFLLVAVIKLREIYSHKVTTLREWVFAGVMLILSCLTRRNIVYAVIICGVVALAICKGNRIRSLSFFMAVAVISILGDKGLNCAFDAVPASISEASCMVYQQLSRTYIEKGPEAFAEEELALLYDFSYGDAGLRQYDPAMADYTKAAFAPNVDRVGKGVIHLYKLWLKKGLQNPKEYIDAFMYNTYQAWYPLTYIIEHKMNRSYFEVGSWYDENGKPNVPIVMDAVENIAVCGYKNIPVLRVLFSIGFWFLLAFLAWLKGMYQKDNSIIISIGLVLAVCATSLLGPISLVRYYLILMYIGPLAIFILVGKNYSS